MNVKKYLNKLNWKFKQDKRDDLYYMFYNGVKISSFGVDKPYPDEGLILLKSTLREVQDIKRRGLLGLWFQIKSKLNMVDSRLDSLDSSQRSLLKLIENPSLDYLRCNTTLNYYDQYESIKNTMNVQRRFKINLKNEFMSIFGEELTI